MLQFTMGFKELAINQVSQIEHGRRRLVSELEGFILHNYYLARYQFSEDDTDWVRAQAVNFIKGRPNVRLSILRDPKEQHAFTAIVKEETEPYTMPHFVARRVLNAIPNNEIAEKRFLELFAGYGAISFLLNSGWKVDRPSSITMCDLAYNPQNEDNRVRIDVNWVEWVHLLKPHIPSGDMYFNHPDYLALSTESNLPFESQSFDTIFMDPPFGIKTKLNRDPVAFTNIVMAEIPRILTNRGTAYCLYPNDIIDGLKLPESMKFTTISKNVGRTNFDIALLKIGRR